MKSDLGLAEFEVLVGQSDGGIGRAVVLSSTGITGRTLNTQRKGIGGQDSSEESSGLSPLFSLIGTHLETPTHPRGGDNWEAEVTHRRQ